MWKKGIFSWFLILPVLLLNPGKVYGAGAYSLAYSSYLGGSGFEYISDIEVDAAGNIYVSGSTTSSVFPSSSNPATIMPGTVRGNSDMFIAKFSPTGTLLKSIIIGGPNKDTAYGLNIDSQGNIIFSGGVGSGFPTKVPFGSQLKSSYTTNPYGVNMVFIKFSPDLSGVVWSGFFANGDGHPPRETVLDSSGNLYVISAADTISPYPASFLNSKNSGQDTVIFKISGDGMRLGWGRYFGGSGNDNVGSIALDAANNVYIWSWTSSTDLLTTTNAFDRSYNGGDDAYLAKFSSDGTQVLYATYFGGSGDEVHGGKHNLAVDSSGNAYASAETGSTNLPTTSNAFRPTRPQTSSLYLFLVKLSTTSNQLLGATYVDNGPSEAVAVNSAGEMFVGGNTQSASFPTVDPIYPTLNQGNDAFFIKMNATLSTMLFGTYMGGSGSGNPWEEGFRAVTLDGLGNVYLAGQSYSSDWPLTANAYQKIFGGGGSDIVFAKFSPASVSSVGNGDANGDLKVDTFDLKAVLAGYLKSVTNALNQYGVDAKTNVLDFVVVLKRLP